MIWPLSFLDGKVVLYPGDCLDVLDQMPADSVDSVCTDPPYHLASIVKRFGAEDAVEAKEGKTGAFKRASAGFVGKQWDDGDVAFQAATWAAVLRVLKPGGYLVAFASTRGFGRMSVAIEEAGFNTHPLIAFLMQHPDAQDFLATLDAAQLAAFLRLCEHRDLGGILAWIFGSGFPKATRVKAEGYAGFRYGGQALKPAIEPIYMGQKPFSEETGTANILRHGTGALNIGECLIHDEGDGLNRWPANLIHDGSDAVSSTGPASRYFYTAKADAEDRLGSKHPTVKPLDLSQYLCRLITPPGGTVLDPFAGTGTTGEAAWREGFAAVLIEREPEYQADIARRMDLVLKPARRSAVAKSKNQLRGAEGSPLFPDGRAA